MEEDNYGMDGKVSRPSIASDTNWQGLEELSSGNDNTDEYRLNPRLSLEPWTSPLKAVDSTLALPNSHSEQNKADGTPPAQSRGFPVASAELLVSTEMASAELLVSTEMASAESGEDPSHVVGETLPLTLPANLHTLYLNRPTLSPARKLEWSNDIPEANHLNSEHWRKSKTENLLGWEESHHLEGDVSGNGVTELVFWSHRRLQPISQHQGERRQDVEPEEDGFEEQLHPHVHSDRTARHLSSASRVEQPTHSSHTEITLTKMQKDATKEWIPCLEGSASSPLTSD